MLMQIKPTGWCNHQGCVSSPLWDIRCHLARSTRFLWLWKCVLDTMHMGLLTCLSAYINWQLCRDHPFLLLFILSYPHAFYPYLFLPPFMPDAPCPLFTLMSNAFLALSLVLCLCPWALCPRLLLFPHAPLIKEHPGEKKKSKSVSLFYPSIPFQTSLRLL